MDFLANQGLLLVVFLVMGALLAVGAVLVVRDTLRGRGRWGINFKRLHCPRCGEPAPFVRVPRHARQAEWGGHTCSACGTEFDKWGQPVADESAAAGR
ncbi:MAG TPA: hypothetical protein PKD86_18720 [Gemmatales bacterium]|nr:hypothetical protein [Gemmatales bacterium]